MTNPLIEIRDTTRHPSEDRPLTQQEFAISLGVSGSTISNLERGVIELSPALLTALAAAGYDAEKIRAEYKVFRASLVAQMSAAVEAGR